jgi:hypothetical protein
MCWTVLGSVGSEESIAEGVEEPALGSMSGIMCGSLEEATAGVTGG